MTFEELCTARQVLGLDEEATLAEIKARHRELVKRHHPDRDSEQNNETIRRINTAYQVITAYVGAYRFSFSEETFFAHNPEERIRQQFMHDPIWGG